MFSLFKYLYDLFGWTYRKCYFMNEKYIVKIYYYDLGEAIKNKFGQFFTPDKESVIRQKHMLISFFEFDDAKPLSPFELQISNNDGTATHEQKLTTKEKLSSEPSKEEIKKVEDFQRDKKGALPLLNVKLNPMYLQAQMEVKSLREMKKVNNGMLGNMKFEDMLVIGGIIVVAIVVIYAFYSGMIKF